MTESMADYRVLKSQLAWDMIQHDHMLDPHTQERFGLNPASPDVVVMQERASYERLNSVASVYPEIKKLCGVASGVVQRAILNIHAEDECEQCETIVGMVATALVTSVMADLVNRGLIMITMPEEEHV